MMKKSLLGALALGLATSTSAFAQTEIQWWHAMTGANNDVVNKLAEEFNNSQKDYKVVVSYKGQYADTLNAGIAAFRAGNAPHILQVFEVGTATMMGAKGAIKPVHEMMKEAGEKFDPQGLPAGHHRLLLDRQGRDALLPVQLLLDGHVDQQGRAEEGRHRRDPEDLAAGVRSRQEAEGRRPRDLRLLECLGSLGQHRAVLGLAQHADGHQGQRPRRLRHGDEVQLAGRT